MTNSKIVWIDIGTHFGQEYKSIFSYKTYFIWKLFRRFVASKLLFQGEFITFSQLINLNKDRHNLKKNKGLFHFTFVEANPKILQMKVYSEGNDVFCLALGENQGNNFQIGKLYHVGKDQTSQGNSIYKSKSNVSIDDFTTCLIKNPMSFALEYKNYLDHLYSNYKIVLRVNCEGSEDEIIYAFKKCFEGKFTHIFGSLKDVRTVKGSKSYEKMILFIKENKLNYVNFSSSVLTWPSAFLKLSKMI